MDQPPTPPPYQPPYSQPFSGYPQPSQPVYYQQPPIQPKKSNRTLWIVLGSIGGVIVLCCAIAGIGAALANSGANAGSHNNVIQGPTATPAPPTATPHPQVWKVIKTFTGNGNSQTPDFTVANANFRLVWSCNPRTFDLGEYNIIVDVDPVDQSQFGDAAAINTICRAGNVSGVTNIHDLSGTLYLNVTSEAAWTIHVEVFE